MRLSKAKTKIPSFKIGRGRGSVVDAHPEKIAELFVKARKEARSSDCPRSGARQNGIPNLYQKTSSSSSWNASKRQDDELIRNERLIAKSAPVAQAAIESQPPSNAYAIAPGIPCQNEGSLGRASQLMLMNKVISLRFSGVPVHLSSAERKAIEEIMSRDFFMSQAARLNRAE
jgi:hypothetical protein